MDARIGAGRALLREHALIDGAAATSGAWIEVDDPAEETPLGRVPRFPAADADRAIRVAAEGFRPWANTPAFERARVLRRWHAGIEGAADALAALISLENGKPFPEALAEVAYANAFIGFMAGEAERLDGRLIEPTSGQGRVMVLREPVGPVAAITPWNFPAAMLTRKVAPALAAGCTVVCKPASATPFTAIALAELALAAGVPPSALQVVTGDAGEIGGALTASPSIGKLSFTGSTPVGRKLMAQCAPTLKRLSMELGGAAPMLVFDDADIDAAAEAAVAGKFRNGGQSCVSINRFHVHRPVFDRWLDAVAERTRALKVGKPFEDGVQVGPLIDRKAVEKVADHVARLQASGARLTVGGSRLEGRFFQPTLLAGGDDTLLLSEETFGPVIAAFPFDTEEEAYARANASDFGLAAFACTRDLDRAFRAARRIESGIVGINTGVISDAANPFGGIKQSGFGREGSRYGLDDYLQLKAITFAGA